jgi:hypothetical protein
MTLDNTFTIEKNRMLFEICRKYNAKHILFHISRLFWWPFVALCSVGLLVLGASQLELLTIGERTAEAMAITVDTYLLGALQNPPS